MIIYTSYQKQLLYIMEENMQNYQNMFNLTNHIALISGGTGGLGSSIAEAFLQNGANVAVCGGHPENVTALEDIAKQYGRKFLAIRCNILIQAEIDAMLDQIESQLGNVNILVNSAGMNKLLPAEDYDEITFDKVMDLNVKGTHLVTKAIGKRMMIPQKSGHIINISSVKSFLGTQQDYLAYCTSKGAVNMYTKQIACEWAKYNITANAIAPTFVRTAINAFQLDDPIFYDKLVNRIPLGRIGSTKDIAATAVFLASDASSFITGQIIGVDGGLTAIQ